MIMLEIKDLNYYYGDIHAIKGVSFHVNEGEIVTLIGTNGAGKTTTLRCLSGLLDNKGLSGEIMFLGKTISKMQAHKITSLGICQVLEGRHIFPQLSVGENIEVGAYLRKDKGNIKDEIKKIYKQFPRLEERQKQSGGSLSGGEQQMLAIARALIGGPKLILMDEPSLGLAPLIVKEIFEIIKSIKKAGTTILLVEQNSKAALNIADRGYVLETGKIVMDDTASNLLNNEQVQRSYLGA
jgi:branched-chain amino acid transport system ATP-binding protein